MRFHRASWTSWPPPRNHVEKSALLEEAEKTLRWHGVPLDRLDLPFPKKGDCLYGGSCGPGRPFTTHAKRGVSIRWFGEGVEVGYTWAEVRAILYDLIATPKTDLFREFPPPVGGEPMFECCWTEEVTPPPWERDDLQTPFEEPADASFQALHVLPITED